MANNNIKCGILEGWKQHNNINIAEEIDNNKLKSGIYEDFKKESHGQEIMNLLFLVSMMQEHLTSKSKPRGL